MNAVDFKESNMTLRAGDNPNTIGLRICIAKWNQMPGYHFYVSKWEMGEREKEAYKKRLECVLNREPQEMQEFVIKTLMENLPVFYLSQMNAPVPVMVLSDSPFDEPNFLVPNNEAAKPSTGINNHPKEN